MLRESIIILLKTEREREKGKYSHVQQEIVGIITKIKFFI